MDIDIYKPSKTVKKAVLPVSIIILLNIALSFVKQAGVSIDESIVWQIALAGYGGIVTFINWIKNHKRGKEASG
jgi:hypothetical protein